MEENIHNTYLRKGWYLKYTKNSLTNKINSQIKNWQSLDWVLHKRIHRNSQCTCKDVQYH